MRHNIKATIKKDDKTSKRYEIFLEFMSDRKEYTMKKCYYGYLFLLPFPEQQYLEIILRLRKLLVRYTIRKQVNGVIKSHDQSH